MFLKRNISLTHFVKKRRKDYNEPPNKARRGAKCTIAPQNSTSTQGGKEEAAAHQALTRLKIDMFLRRKLSLTYLHKYNKAPALTKVRTRAFVITKKHKVTLGRELHPYLIHLSYQKHPRHGRQRPVRKGQMLVDTGVLCCI